MTMLPPSSESDYILLSSQVEYFDTHHDHKQSLCTLLEPGQPRRRRACLAMVWTVAIMCVVGFLGFDSVTKSAPGLRLLAHGPPLPTSTKVATPRVLPHITRTKTQLRYPRPAEAGPHVQKAYFDDMFLTPREPQTTSGAERDEQSFVFEYPQAMLTNATELVNRQAAQQQEQELLEMMVQLVELKEEMLDAAEATVNAADRRVCTPPHPPAPHGNLLPSTSRRAKKAHGRNRILRGHLVYQTDHSAALVRGNEGQSVTR